MWIRRWARYAGTPAWPFAAVSAAAPISDAIEAGEKKKYRRLHVAHRDPLSVRVAAEIPRKPAAREEGDRREWQRRLG